MSLSEATRDQTRLNQDFVCVCVCARGYSGQGELHGPKHRGSSLQNHPIIPMQIIESKGARKTFEGQGRKDN